MAEPRPALDIGSVLSPESLPPSRGGERRAKQSRMERNQNSAEIGLHPHPYRIPHRERDRQGGGQRTSRGRCYSIPHYPSFDPPSFFPPATAQTVATPLGHGHDPPPRQPLPTMLTTGLSTCESVHGSLTEDDRGRFAAGWQLHLHLGRLASAPRGRRVLLGPPRCLTAEYRSVRCLCLLMKSALQHRSTAQRSDAVHKPQEVTSLAWTVRQADTLTD